MHPVYVDQDVLAIRIAAWTGSSFKSLFEGCDHGLLNKRNEANSHLRLIDEGESWLHCLVFEDGRDLRSGST